MKRSKSEAERVSSANANSDAGKKKNYYQDSQLGYPCHISFSKM